MKILDFHAHVGEDIDGLEESIESLAKSMEESGITHSVVFPFNQKEYSVENASTALLEKVADRAYLLPFLRFDPKKMTPKILEAMLPRFKGVKLHPRAQKFDPLGSDFYQLYEVIQRSGKPLLVHTRKEGISFTDPERVIMLGYMFPDLNLVLAHFANNTPSVIREVRHHKNVYLETSIYVSPHGILEAAETIGADKILFGSDIPYSNHMVESLRITTSGLKQSDQERILYHTAAQLLMLE